MKNRSFPVISVVLLILLTHLNLIGKDYRHNPQMTESQKILLDHRPVYVNLFEFSDSLFKDILFGYTKQLKMCDYFKPELGYRIHIYSHENSILIGGYATNKRWRYLKFKRYGYIINGITVITTEYEINNPPISDFIKINPATTKIRLSPFGSDDPEIIEAQDDEGIQLVLTFDGKKLVKSELYYDCELCPPVDKTLFPEGTEFHLWGCDE